MKIVESIGVNYEVEGEREADVQRRLCDTMTEIMLRDNHDVVLAISHGAACMEFMRAWQPYAAFRYDGIPGNCGIMRFEVRPAGEKKCCAEKPAATPSAGSTGAFPVPAPPKLIFTLVDVMEPDPEEINNN